MTTDPGAVPDRDHARTGTDGRRLPVTLVWDDGRSETVAVARDETVIAAAERAGIGLPFGCLRGVCATCTGRLVEGELAHRREPRALKPRHREAGFVLLCVAEPRAPSRVRVGSDVQAQLNPNPLGKRE